MAACALPRTDSVADTLYETEPDTTVWPQRKGVPRRTPPHPRRALARQTMPGHAGTQLAQPSLEPSKWWMTTDGCIVHSPSGPPCKERSERRPRNKQGFYPAALSHGASNERTRRDRIACIWRPKFLIGCDPLPTEHGQFPTHDHMPDAGLKRALAQQRFVRRVALGDAILNGRFGQWTPRRERSHSRGGGIADVALGEVLNPAAGLPQRVGNARRHVVGGAFQMERECAETHIWHGSLHTWKRRPEGRPFTPAMARQAISRTARHRLAASQPALPKQGVHLSTTGLEGKPS